MLFKRVFLFRKALKAGSFIVSAQFLWLIDFSLLSPGQTLDIGDIPRRLATAIIFKKSGHQAKLSEFFSCLSFLEYKFQSPRLMSSAPLDLSLPSQSYF